MKIICFSSYMSIWFYAFPEAVIAHELEKKGHEVLYITPGDQFVRRSDLMNERILRKGFNLRGYEIGSVITNKDKREIDLLMSNLNQKNFEKLIIDGINIGKMALYEVLLNHKKMSLDFSKEEWKECLSETKNTLISFYACRSILTKEKPDRVLMYNSLYSVNQVWEKYAKLMNIPAYFLHNGENLSDRDDTLVFGKNDAMYYSNSLKNTWLKVKNIPVPLEIVRYVTNHFLELLKAKHNLVYSSPKSKKILNIRKFFNVKDGQKLLTATMSSNDEIFAAQYAGSLKVPKDLIFTTQTDWIKQLVSYVKNKSDLFLLIRVHPREFPNKADNVKSEHARVLQKVLKDLPENVKVNWPTDNISIYDLAQETDVFLNAWSSVGVEMSLLGIPVVTYSKDLIVYPSDLNYIAKDRDDYFAKIELALKNGWNYERIKKTYRWLALRYSRTVIKFRNNNRKESKEKIDGSFLSVFNYLYSRISPKTRSVISKLLIIIPGLGVGEKQKEDCARQLGEKVDISRVEKMLIHSADNLIDMKEVLTRKVSNKSEDGYIRAEIKRIYTALYGNMNKGIRIKENSLQYNLENIVKNV